MPAKKTSTTKKAASESEQIAEAVKEKEHPSLVGSMRGTVLWYGDLISPIDVEWDANK